MATIDLIVLGIVKKEPLSAYDIQKLVEYRNISRWVKISTPSIYKKSNSAGAEGFHQGYYDKGEEYGGKSRIFTDRGRRRGIQEIDVWHLFRACSYVSGF